VPCQHNPVCFFGVWSDGGGVLAYFFLYLKKITERDNNKNVKKEEGKKEIDLI